MIPKEVQTAMNTDMRELERLGFSLLERGKKKWLAADQSLLEKKPARIFALAKLCATWDIPVHRATVEVARKLSPELGRIKVAELRECVEEILLCGDAAKAIRQLDEMGALSVVLPELTAMKGVLQPEEFHPEGDVFTHTLLCLTMLEKEKGNNFLLMLGTLLHDVGKPATFTKSDRVRFNRHESVGAALALKVAKRLALAEEERETLGYLVKAHMKFKNVKNMRRNRLKNFVLDDRFQMLVSLVRADCLASHGNTSDCDFAVKAREEFIQNVPVAPLIRGRDLIELGLAPGPVFSTILREVEERRKAGKINTREDALAFVRGHYTDSAR
jgi:poly(A) polymerase